MHPGPKLLSDRTGSPAITQEEPQTCTPSSLGHCSMKTEHGNQVSVTQEGRGCLLPVALYESFQPRFSPELSLRNTIWTLWVCVLMGSGAFSPQKGPKTFGPALICEGQDGENEGHIRAVVAAAETTLTLHLGFPGNLHMNP